MCILAKLWAKLAGKIDYNLNFSTVLNIIEQEKVRKPCKITMYLHSKNETLYYFCWACVSARGAS